MEGNRRGNPARKNEKDVRNNKRDLKLTPKSHNSSSMISFCFVILPTRDHLYVCGIEQQSWGGEYTQHDRDIEASRSLPSTPA